MEDPAAVMEVPAAGMVGPAAAIMARVMSSKERIAV